MHLKEYFKWILPAVNRRNEVGNPYNLILPHSHNQINFQDIISLVIKTNYFKTKENTTRWFRLELPGLYSKSFVQREFKTQIPPMIFRQVEILCEIGWLASTPRNIIGPTLFTGNRGEPCCYILYYTYFVEWISSTATFL